MSRLEAEVSTLNGHLVGLQHSWSGSAATAFQAVVAEWTATQRRVEQNLADINRALAFAAEQYAETEAGNARLFQR